MIPLPVFPFTVQLSSSEGRDCIITLDADGGWKGDADHLESTLAEMAAEEEPGACDKVVLWLLLREMQRGRHVDDPTDEAVRIALGHLAFRLHDAALSQGFLIDQDFICTVMEEAGLMVNCAPIKACFPLTPLADACVRAYLATLPNDEEER